MKTYWISSDILTVQATVDNKGIIKCTAPVTKSFVGQEIRYLMAWMKKQGGFKYEIMHGGLACQG